MFSQFVGKKGLPGGGALSVLTVSEWHFTFIFRQESPVLSLSFQITYWSLAYLKVNIHNCIWKDRKGDLILQKQDPCYLSKHKWKNQQKKNNKNIKLVEASRIYRQRADDENLRDKIKVHIIRFREMPLCQSKTKLWEVHTRFAHVHSGWIKGIICKTWKPFRKRGEKITKIARNRKEINNKSSDENTLTTTLQMVITEFDHDKH